MLIVLNFYTKAQQNLIPNGGFEDYNTIPDLFANWYNCNVWDNANGTGTPDYFHIYGSNESQLPDSYAAHLWPHSGEAIMGFLTWSSSSSGANYREYLSIELTDPLVIGVPYSLSFWITNGESNYYVGNSSNNVGIALSTTTIEQTANNPIGITPTFNNQNQIWSPSWQQITYSFIADSSYSYLTIGNFYPDSLTNNSPQATYPNSFTGSYYFVDDFELHHDLGPLTFTGDTTICINDTTILTASNGFNYVWVNNDNPQTVLSYDSTLVVSPISTSTYTLFGLYDTLEITVEVSPMNPELDKFYELCRDSSLILAPTYSPDNNYLWQDGSNNPTYIVEEPGTYWVQLNHSCGSSIDTTIVLQVECVSIVEMPNVFTPNEDNINDYFTPIKAQGVYNPELSILNRWGNLLYKTTDLEQGWSGKSHEVIMNDGVYYWLLTYVDVNGVSQIKQGIVHLLK